MIPIGIADLAARAVAVILNMIYAEQSLAMPPIHNREVTHEMADELREAIGSQPALGMKEEVVELDSTKFYQYHHFDRGNLNRIVQGQLGKSAALRPL